VAAKKANGRPYTGTKDGAAKGKRKGTEKFVDLLEFFFKTKNLGTWVVRDMRGKPGQLSVHATGRASDNGHGNVKKLEELADGLAAHADLLGIEEIHNYSYGKFGRGWRCDRHAWKVYANEKESAGSIGGKWIHVELTPEMADDPKKVEEAFKQMFS
jgi:hypothetical protein